MILPDVNLLVYAHREELEQHAAAKLWLTTDRGFARYSGLRWRNPLA